MRIALCIFRYFPYGGLQKDCLRVAEECARRGHRVEIFCSEKSEIAESETVSPIRWRVLKTKGWTNHSMARSFEAQFLNVSSKEKFDCILGFNRMAGLDFYFAGDGCFAEGIRARGGIFPKKWLPRYRTFLQMEKQVASSRSRTRILTLTTKQKEDFSRWYKTQEERFDILPIGFDPRCGKVANPATVRERLREELGVAPTEIALALIGSDFKRKGGDRAIAAFAALPDALRSRTKFFLVGQADSSKYIELAENLNLSNSVFALGGREDVPELMCALDLLVHPAREEAGGSVLIEAAVSGLPVICTDICGFAPQIRCWDCGVVVPSPFNQEVFNAMFAGFVQRLSVTDFRRCPVRVNPALWKRAGVIVDALEKHVAHSPKE